MLQRGADGIKYSLAYKHRGSHGAVFFSSMQALPAPSILEMKHKKKGMSPSGKGSSQGTSVIHAVFPAERTET